MSDFFAGLLAPTLGATKAQGVGLTYALMASTVFYAWAGCTTCSRSGQVDVLHRRRTATACSDSAECRADAGLTPGIAPAGEHPPTRRERAVLHAPGTLISAFVIVAYRLGLLTG